MDSPKISVLIPLYNRKHYIEDCINSVLIQTFQDFEIIVCDDKSIDGSAEFVAKRFSSEISSGKLKLLRNERNISEFPNDNRLLREATGKYVMILHSDDLFLYNALEQMYETAEYFKADVVHAGTFLKSLEGGIIDDSHQLKVMSWENRLVKNFEIVSDEPATRFKEWRDADTFIDAQYNIFRREFLIDNGIFFPNWGGNPLFCLHWLMKAKIYVKTPDIFYICRDAPDSLSNDKKFLAEKVYKFIVGTASISEYFNNLFSSVKFFRDNPRVQYHARAIFYDRFDDFRLHRLKIYEQGITPEIHSAVERAVKENFGEQADYVTFLFHLVHCLKFKRNYQEII